MHHLEIVSQLDAQHLEQLPELIEAATRADGHEPLGEHKFLRLCRGDDLAAAVLAFEDGRLAGYAHTVTYGARDARRASCEIVVHPAFRLRGIGRMLISHAIMHAHRHDARQLDLWAYNHNGASARIAGQFGFRPARQLLHLHRHMSELPAAPIGGGTLRAFRPGIDDAGWLALNNRIFAAHPENGAWTLDDLHARIAQPWFEPRDLVLLEAGGELAGFCWLKVSERPGEGRVGEIYVIGTAPEFQGRGFGRRLLAHGLAHLAARGAQVAAIYVDQSNAPAVRLYESTGFHHHHVDVCYQRALAAQELHAAA
ncbi:MAG TPA: mycothiol synthase [Dehalococcoidia bacterium]|nr:mycothiol synthase [Dehalococcoidia bacterium]